MRTEMRRAIPLEDPALFRFALIRVSDDHTLWFQKFHHIIMDATSRRLLSARTASPLSRVAFWRTFIRARRRHARRAARCRATLHRFKRP